VTTCAWYEDNAWLRSSHIFQHCFLIDACSIIILSTAFEQAATYEIGDLNVVCASLLVTVIFGNGHIIAIIMVVVYGEIN